MNNQVKGWLAAAKRRGVPKLKKQGVSTQKQRTTGAAIEKVMNAYASFSKCDKVCPGQKELAKRAGVSERTVRVVQDWLIENGWLVVIASAIPGVQGPTVVFKIPSEEEATEVIDPKIIEERVVAERRKRRDAERAQERTPSVITDSEPVGGLTRDAWGRYEDAHGRKYDSVEEARRKGASQDVTPTATLVREVRRPNGEVETVTNTVPDPTGRIAAAEARRQGILDGTIEVGGPAWDRAEAPDFD